MSTKTMFVRFSALLMILSVLLAACAPAAPTATAEPQVITNTVVAHHTTADLAGSEAIQSVHLGETLQSRFKRTMGLQSKGSLF